MGYKNGIYWKAEQDDKMRILLSTDKNTSLWVRTYYDMLPRLKYMGINILRKYYYVSDEKKADDLIMEAISALLVNGTYNPDKPKLYAYCGTIMKRYFYDVLVNNKPDEKIDDNYDASSDEYVINKYQYIPDFDEFDMSNRKELLTILNKMLDEAIEKCTEVIINRRDNLPEPKFGKKRERDFLITARQYLNKYLLKAPVTAMSLGDYLQNELDMPDYVLADYMRKYFNIGTQPRLHDSKDVVDWIERRESTYILDDYCPNNSQYDKRKKRNTDFNYF